MDVLKKVIEQTSWQVLGKAVTSIASLFLLGVITRNYGEYGTGIFTLSLAYLNFFYFASDIGLNAHLLPNLKDDLTFRKLLGMRIVWSGVLTLLAILCLPLINNNQDFIFSTILASPAILASSLFITTSLIFQKHLRFSYSSLSLGIGAIAAVLVVFILLQLKAPPAYLVVAHLVDWILAAFLALIFARKLTSSLYPVFDMTFVKKTLKEVWPLSVTLLISLVYFRVDAFMLSRFRSIDEVGVYNVAYSLFQSALLASTFIVNSYYPLMLKAKEKSLKEFNNQIVKACLLMGSLALAGLIFTYITTPLFISLISGNSGFTGSVESLRILSLGFPAFFISSILMWVLITKRSYKTLVAIYLSGLVLNITLNSLFIPQYSYIAASWVTIISEYFILVIQILLLSFFSRRR